MKIVPIAISDTLLHLNNTEGLRVLCFQLREAERACVRDWTFLPAGAAASVMRCRQHKTRLWHQTQRYAARWAEYGNGTLSAHW